MACSSRPPDGATSRNGARTAARRVGQRAGQPLGDPGRGQRGDEHRVGAVDRPAILLVQPHDDLGHVARGQDAEGADGQVDGLAGAVDRDALAPHQPERLVHRAERVGAQRHRARGSRRPRRRPRRGRAPPSSEVRARRWRCPRRARVHLGPGPCPPVRAPPPRRGARPAPRPSRRRAARAPPGGPATSTSSTSTPGQHARAGAPPAARGRPSPACGRRGRRRCRRDAGRWPAAGAWGRAAPRPRAATAPGRPRPSRRPAPGRGPGTGLRRLPPKAPPLASGEAGRPAGPAPAGVGLDVGRLDPGGLQRERPLARGQRRPDGTGAPCCCGPGRGRAPARAARTDGASGGVGAELDQRAGRGGVVGEAAVAEDHVGPRGLEGRPLDLGPPGGQAAGRAGRRPAAGAAARRVDAQRVAGRLDDRLPAGAAAQVGAQRRLDVPPRRRARTAALVERGQAHHDAGRAEAALARPVGDEGGGPAVALLGRQRPRGW